MTQIVITIEAESGHITQTQILAKTMQDEEYALDRLKMFLPALHKFRKSLREIIHLYKIFEYQDDLNGDWC